MAGLDMYVSPKPAGSGKEFYLHGSIVLVVCSVEQRVC